jgi:hypothetical protein
MKKVIRLTELDLIRLVKKIIKEQTNYEQRSYDADNAVGGFLNNMSGGMYGKNKIKSDMKQFKYQKYQEFRKQVLPTLESKGFQLIRGSNETRGVFKNDRNTVQFWYNGNSLRIDVIEQKTQDYYSLIIYLTPNNAEDMILKYTLDFGKMFDGSIKNKQTAFTKQTGSVGALDFLKNFNMSDPVSYIKKGMK